MRNEQEDTEADNRLRKKHEGRAREGDRSTRTRASRGRGAPPHRGACVRRPRSRLLCAASPSLTPGPASTTRSALSECFSRSFNANESERWTKITPGSAMVATARAQMALPTSGSTRALQRQHSPIEHSDFNSPARSELRRRGPASYSQVRGVFTVRTTRTP